MCATFRIDLEDDVETLREIARRIEERYGTERLNAISGKDLFPKSEAPVVGPTGIGLLRWGYPLEDSPKVVFNARSENLLQKPMFRQGLQRRCAVPASAFYEWDHRGSRPARMRVRIAGEPFFYLAGLWQHFLKADGQSMNAFVVLTTAPNEAMSRIHDRMPAILLPSMVDDWISDDRMPSEALAMMVPFIGAMQMEVA